ncbi:MAG: PAS domain S-box protein [Bacteroidetes bacterium]|nr:MAG: PAS domain S-box protein [Bacteroidota bacterium]
MKIPLRLLLAEDSETDAALLIRELEKAGYEVSCQQVDTAGEMEEALRNDEWDLVISDYHIPGFGGREALRLLQQSGLAIPFILISGTIGEENAVEIMKAGAQDYLMKGNLAKLPAVVSRELAEAQNRRERKELQDELNTLLSISIDMIFISGMDGYFKRVNPAVEKILGYTSAEMLSRNYFEFVHPEDMASTLEIINKLREGYIIQSFVNRFVCKNGSIKWLEWNTRPLGDKYYSIVRDISERVLAQEEIRKANERFDLAVQGSSDGIWDWFPAEDLAYFSPRFRELMGYPATEYIGGMDALSQVTHPDDLERTVAALTAHLEGQGPFEVEYRLKTVAGEYRWFLVRGQAIWDEAGRPVRMAGSLTDIHKGKVAQEELTRAFNLVNEQNKRLLNFSYIVSHNLRSHTSNISAILRYIEETDSMAEKIEMFEKLKSVSQYLDETLYSLNEVVSIQTRMDISREMLCLHAHVEKALTLLCGMIHSRGAVIENRVDPEIMIEYNLSYLDSILLNFISNALRYSHPERRCHVVIDCLPEKTGWRLLIQDNGIGIDLDKHGPKLFGMYKTFHGNPDAKGLGLFITKNQVEAMGGCIEVNSRPNEGTTFNVYMP